MIFGDNMTRVNYNKIIKDVSEYVQELYDKGSAKDGNYKNPIFYNVQRYYLLCIDILFKEFCLYDYEYEIIVKEVMSGFKSVQDKSVCMLYFIFYYIYQYYYSCYGVEEKMKEEDFEKLVPFILVFCFGVFVGALLSVI